MQNPANAIVNHFGLGKRLVTALVGNNPKTGRKETRAEAVERPERDASSGIEEGMGEGNLCGGNEGV